MTQTMPVLVLLLVLVAAPVGAGTKGGLNRLTLEGSLQALDFEQVHEKREDIPRLGPAVGTLSPTADRLEDASMVQTADRFRGQEMPNDARRQPYRHFMPALNGATGLIDLPVAYTQPRKTFVVSLQTESMRAGPAFWDLPYRSVRQKNRYLTVNYGATNAIEFQLDGEFWTKDFRYNDPVTFTDPTFSVSDKFFFGFGSKWTFPFLASSVERVWMGIGFRTHFFQNTDRNVTEFHEYERLTNVYAVVSGKATKELFGHFMYRYVTYDWRGGTFPSGATDVFLGWSPTNAWGQLGLAAEWYLFPDLAIMVEGTRDTNVQLLGSVNPVNLNAGARYTYGRFGVGFWAKRINHRDLEQNGLQASVRF